jgi:hypothetical protein
VLRMQKETTKIRPVFDCAAKTKGVCLNDFLTQGPQVMNELVSVMHYFRRYDIAMTGDIAEMFLQVQVAEEDRDYLRFLIFREEQLLIYRWRVHLFGKTDSPCIAMVAVFTQILKQKDMYPEAYKTITTASLVDDMADSRPTTQQTEVLINELSDFFPNHCAMHRRKFVVNDKKLMLKIPNDDRIEALKEDTVVEEIFSGNREQPSVKILGISWNYVTDQMYFDFSTVIGIGKVGKVLDKLILLSILHSLYDPLGVLILLPSLGN